VNDEFSDWDAAYVAGLLSPDERRSFERHLAECPACAKAVSEIAGLPGLLGRLAPAEAEALLAGDPVPGSSSTSPTSSSSSSSSSQEPGRVQDLARRAGRSRRRARRRLGALVAGGGVLVAAVGLLAGLGLGFGGTAPTAPAPEAQATSTASPGVVRAMAQVEPGWLDAELTVSEKGWGTRFDWNCSYRVEPTDVYEPVDYDLVVTDAEGVETTVASWSATGTEAGSLSASTRIPTTDIRSVDIRLTDTDRPLVRTTL
jgi:hypothetical protein